MEIINLDLDESKLLKPGQMSSQELGEISFFGFSLTGESHKRSFDPCQDANYVRMVNNHHPVLIASIADGVGSCDLAHYGSSIAVKTATEYLVNIFARTDISTVSDTFIGDSIRDAMKRACDEIKKEAEKSQTLEFSYHTTLTIAIYDGTNLYYGHVGDDGIVVLGRDRKLQLITTRMKGEEIQSVYPLQFDPKIWEVRKCSIPIDGFMMATDGILDAVVANEYHKNIVYPPFFEPAFVGINPLLETGKSYANIINTPNFRNTVTDDITVVFCMNNQRLKNNPCKFDVTAWNEEMSQQGGNLSR